MYLLLAASSPIVVSGCYCSIGNPVKSSCRDKKLPPLIPCASCRQAMTCSAKLNVASTSRVLLNSVVARHGTRSVTKQVGSSEGKIKRRHQNVFRCMKIVLFKNETLFPHVKQATAYFPQSKYAIHHHHLCIAIQNKANVYHYLILSNT